MRTKNMKSSNRSKSLSILASAAVVLGGCIWLASQVQAEDAPAETQTPPVKLPAKEKFHLFILAGQSNMAGRGVIEEEDKVANPRVLTLTKDGKWVPAVDPIHFDKPGSGVGPGRGFGLAMAKKLGPDVTIGLIPCAHGGSPIASWEPGAKWYQTNGHPYDDAIARANLALKDGVLKGILWHQGESDAGNKAPKYQANLTALIARFRKDLQVADLSVLLGQLGPFRKEANDENSKILDTALRSVAKEDGNAAFVSAEGLTSNGDFVHFDNKSQRELGRRYAEAYLKLMDDRLQEKKAASGK
jgi:hypothetical protein